MVLKLRGTPRVSVGDVEVAAINYTDWLDSSELLTGTPTATEVTSTDLTISSVGVSTASMTIGGDAVITAKAVKFKVIGGTTANSPYSIRVTVSTDATVARTAIRDCLLEYV